jgi:hypothetical protein
MNIDSPFEQWRLKYMKGTAASRDIMELLALAFEGGRVAEREACAITAWSIGHDLYLKHHDIREVGSACATAIRARGEK